MHLNYIAGIAGVIYDYPYDILTHHLTNGRTYLRVYTPQM